MGSLKIWSHFENTRLLLSMTLPHLEQGDFRRDTGRYAAVGRYVTIEGNRRRFFGIITDVSLGVTDEQFTLTPPNTSDPFISDVLYMVVDPRIRL
jgi:hypothetical protein